MSALNVNGNIDGTPKYIRDETPTDSSLAISNNKIGIGTTDVGAKLTVASSANDSVNGIGKFTNSDLTSDGDCNFLLVGKDADTAKSSLFGYRYHTNNDNAGAFVAVWGDNPATQSLFVKKGGNVGIGTPDPKGLLQLNKSYIVAPAPTGNATTDYWSIRLAIMAVYNQVEGENVTGTVYLQAGTYCVTFSGGDDDCIFALDVASCCRGLKIIGAGRGVTVIKIDYSTAPKAVFRISDSSITIQDLSICSAQTKTHTGVKFSGGWYGAVENVQISNMNAGILLTGSAGFGGSCNNAFRDVLISTCNTGVQLGESGSNNVANCNTFFGGKINDNTYCGVRFVNGMANVLSGVDMGGNNWVYGAVSFEWDSPDGGTGNSIIGCYLEQWGTPVVPPIRIASKFNRIIGCYVGTTAELGGINWVSGYDGADSGNVVFGNQITDADPIQPKEVMLSRLGIGTTNPGEKLEVNGKIKVAAGNYSLTLEENDIVFGRDGHSYIKHINADSGALFIQAGSSANNKLGVNEYGVKIGNSMTTGNGSGDPILNVNGNIKASGSVQLGAKETSNPAAGMLAWDSGHVKVYDGSTWQTIW